MEAMGTGDWDFGIRIAMTEARRKYIELFDEKRSQMAKEWAKVT
jgi:hypothetical protein